MKLSFLRSSHGISAVKKFTQEGVVSYPNIRKFDSHDLELPDDIDGLHSKVELCRQAGATGACMLKGYLTSPLANSSRSGKVNREAKTNNLILDIDGITLDAVNAHPPFNRQQLTVYAEAVVNHLPDCFKHTSYIVHASSSMGMKDGRICLHLDFMLDDYVTPQALKEYVVWMNFNVGLFDKNQALSASGTALRFALDRTVVDNSHLIFLGHPVFEDGIVDPIPDPSDRIFLVEKRKHQVSLAAVIEENADPIKNRKAIQQKIDALRTTEGLPKRTERATQVNVDGRSINVVVNPESCTMTFAADNGEFVAYNVNGGDSAGYYVVKSNPTVVYNFKGEPNFLFEKADAKTYQWHLDTFIGTEDSSDQQANARPLPIVFRDEGSNVYYNATINTATGRIDRIARASREGLADWMAQYEGVMPENVPVWNFEFDPHRDELVSFPHRFINKYIPAPLMKRAELPPGTEPLDYNSAIFLTYQCPRITELIMHVCAGDLPTFCHFINWLAAALQTRDKLGTAWIFQGTQGTGKGVLFDKIITPLVGHGIDSSQPYAAKLLLENFENEFNQFQECALFIGLDEFRLNDSKASQRLLNKIKLLITEGVQPIRAMRENHRMVRSYSNFIILSNDYDVIYIPEGDRRFNVAPRQESKLNKIWPFEGDVIEHEIPAELPYFAQHMLHFQVDMASAKTVIENDAKAAMRVTTRTSIEDFVRAFKEGDLEFFLPILEMPPDPSNTGYIRPAQALMKTFLLDYGEETRVTVEQLRVIYCSFIGNSENAVKFAKMLKRYGMDSRSIRVRKRASRGYTTRWKLEANNIKDLTDMYITEVDRALQGNITSIQGESA